tara:strand:- start:2900 stop:3976 length:1077 start_codon:yes stop_codon:yes gene_type:complete
MKVCIIGNGLSSLTLAKALINENIYVDIFTQKKNNLPNKSRTIGISKSNIDFFNNNILNIDKLTWKLKNIEIFTDNLKNEKLLNFRSKEDQLFSILKNYQLYELLEKKILKNKFFKKKNLRMKVSSIKNYDILINTDYFHPFIKKFFSKKIVKKYNSYAYTTIIKHEKTLNNTATQIFTKYGPLAFLPISENETSIVYSFFNTQEVKNENVKKLIRSYNLKYKDINFQKIHKFELKSLSLRSYYQDKILAFGDLLHKIHPLAGQGFNMTIRDVRILLEIIKKKNSLGLPLDSSVNKEFEERLRHKNLIFSSGIDLIYEFFNLERKSRNNFLSKTVQFLGKNSTINGVFIKIADKGFIL